MTPGATTTETAPTAGDAAKPSQIPLQGWKEVALRTWKEAGKDNLGLVSAGVAFYAFLAFVPLLASVVLTYGLVADPAAVADHIRALTEMMPADAAHLIGEQLRSMTATAGTETGFGLLLALLLSIYGAMRGASAIVTALNIVYDLEESRSFVRATIIAILITLGAVVAMLVAVAAISALAAIDALLPSSSPFVHGLLRVLSWILAAVAVSALVALLFRYAPNRPEAKWRWLTPGSIAATLLWLVATLGFGFYVANFGSYNATYGSLGAVIVFLTWLYLTAYILLLGAELNSEVEKQTRCETTE